MQQYANCCLLEVLVDTGCKGSEQACEFVRHGR